MTAITSPWFYFVGMAWLLLVAQLLARARPEGTSKLSVPIESLRGLCATGVFFCHAVVTYFYIKTGTWKGPPSALYEFLGSGTVDMFFFVSGYLFWSKCISEGGIRSKKSYFIARADRILPAYYVTVGIVLLVVFAHSRFSLRVPPLQLGLEVLGWLAFIQVPINHVQQAPLIDAGVIWTLELEIIFYALLPLLYKAFKGWRVFGYIAILASVFWYTWRSNAFKNTSWIEDPLPMLLTRFFCFGFGFGMVAAFLKSKTPQTWLETLRERRWSVIPILFLAGPVALGLPAHSFLQFLCLLVAFGFIVAGNDLFGLLSMRSTLLLGKSSYSFYLTHGIVLYALTHLLNRYYPIVGLSPVRYWLFMGCCGTATVFLANFLYRTVELRFMKKGSLLRQAGAPRVAATGA